MSNAMYGENSVAAGSPTSENIVTIGQSARGSFTVPTLLPFSVTVYQGTTSTLPAGTAYMYVEARRMR
jgi:hypothetical protein